MAGWGSLPFGSEGWGGYVDLTGVSATGAVGSFGLATGETGVFGTGDVGILGPQLSIAMTGVFGTSAINAMPAGFGVAITGVFATGGVGTVLGTSPEIVRLNSVLMPRIQLNSKVI